MAKNTRTMMDKRTEVIPSKVVKEASSLRRKIPQQTAPRGSARQRVDATAGLTSLAPEVKNANAIPPVNIPSPRQTSIPFKEE